MEGAPNGLGLAPKVLPKAVAGFACGHRQGCHISLHVILPAAAVGSQGQQQPRARGGTNPKGGAAKRWRARHPKSRSAGSSEGLAVVQRNQQLVHMSGRRQWAFQAGTYRL